MQLENLIVPIKIDISTGDVITPREVRYEYPLLLEDKSIQLWSYNLETILAEKIQTILSRGLLNTRMRDFYDVTTLFDRYNDSINYNDLSLAFDKTCRKRETLSLLEHYEEILCSISEDSTLQNLWKNYCRKYKYASHIEFSTNLVNIPWWRSHPIHENRATESICTEPCNPLLRATKSMKRATSTY